MDGEIRDQIIEAKRRLEAGSTVLKAAFGRVEDHIKREVETIRAAGSAAVPEVTFAAVREGGVPAAERDLIRKRGCCIVRGVYDQSQAADWNAELGAYLDRNDYLDKAAEKKGLNKYFSQLDDGQPQIFGIYWSRPQIEARQGEPLALTKRFLNRLWDIAAPHGPEFDPDNDYAYADRVRRRRPGDDTLGLSPHMDSGSYERWTDAAFQKIYAPIFAGNWEDYDPWKAAHRTQTKEYPSPAVCSMFRTFQGWTALTAQGPDDGTLRLVPTSGGMAYVLLRALQGDIADDDLCGAEPGRSLGVTPQWHPVLVEGLVSIPQMQPGDTVWWHPDTVHAVGNQHNGTDFANVIYIGASPRCQKNRAYAEKQAKAFLDGRSAPDFAAEDYEVDFTGRATVDDLTALGRDQMAL